MSAEQTNTWHPSAFSCRDGERDNGETRSITSRSASPGAARPGRSTARSSSTSSAPGSPCRAPTSRASWAPAAAPSACIVNDLIAEGILFEGAKGETARGRKPKFLYIDSRKRTASSPSTCGRRSTSTMVTDLLTEPIVGVSSFPTQPDPAPVRQDARRAGSGAPRGPQGPRPVRGHRPRRAGHGGPRGRQHLVRAAARLARLPAARPAREGDRPARCTSRTPAGPAPSPRRGACAARPAAAATSCSCPCRTASASASSSTARCCAAGTTWRASSATCRSRATGRPARAAPRGAGRPTCRTSPRCRGTSAASLSPRKPIPAEIASFSVDDLVARARGGDSKAVAALQSTAHYLGLGLASVVNAVDPARIFISGEIIAAWDLIEATLRQALGHAGARAGRVGHRDHHDPASGTPAPARRGRAGHGPALRGAESGMTDRLQDLREAAARRREHGS